MTTVAFARIVTDTADTSEGKWLPDESQELDHLLGLAYLRP